MWILYLMIFITIMKVLVITCSPAVPVLQLNDDNLSSERAYRIKPHTCTDRHKVQGICMFQWECRQHNGIMLSTCLDRFLFGTCCKLPSLDQVENLLNRVKLAKPEILTSTTGDILLSAGGFTSSPSNNLGGSGGALVSDHDSTVPPLNLSTPDVKKIFQHFLGNVLINYSVSETSSNVTTEESTFPTSTTTTTTTSEVNNNVITINSTLSSSSSPPPPPTSEAMTTWSQTIPTTETALIYETTTVESSEIDLNHDDSISDVSKEPSTSLDTTTTTTTTTSSSTDTSLSDLAILESFISVDHESHEQNYAEDDVNDFHSETTTTTTTFVEDLYDDTASVDHSDSHDDLSETHFTTTTSTTTEMMTSTLKHFDYKRDGHATLVLSSFSIWTWSSLIGSLLALPTLLWQWLTGKITDDYDDDDGMNKCYVGTLACKTQISEKSSPGLFLSNEAYCGVRPLIPNGRIVGGTSSRFGEWPWQVLIKEATWLGLFVKNKCGGVLLNQRYVVTAAHCQPGFLASLLVIFGESDVNMKNEEYKAMQRNVRRVIVHRKYNALTFDNDLALLELERPVDYEPHVVPICLPPDDEDFTGRNAVVSGWGRIKFAGRLPTTLQYVEVPIMTNSKCQQMFLTAGHIKPIGNKFICAGYRDGGKDSCEGDSGGPLVLQDDEGRWILVGTVSHGIKCAYPNLPGVYIKISAYKNWIQKIINT